jgi:hypothetical protein
MSAVAYLVMAVHAWQVLAHTVLTGSLGVMSAGDSNYVDGVRPGPAQHM